MSREKHVLIERLPTRLRADYLLSTLAVGIFALVMWQVGHLDPVADAATRRVVYGSTAAGGLGLVVAVYTWTNATYSDSSPRMSVVRARQGEAIRRVRYNLAYAAGGLIGVSLAAMLIDKDLTWRVAVFYPWVIAVVTVVLGVVRVLWLQMRLLEIREIDDKLADGPPTPKAFTWNHHA